MGASIPLILELADGILKLWVSKDKRKYIDKRLELDKRFNEENNKDPSHRDDNVLGLIEFELHDLCRAILADSGQPSVAAEP